MWCIYFKIGDILMRVIDYAKVSTLALVSSNCKVLH